MENKLLANEIRDALKLYLNRPSYLEEFTFYENGTIADLLDVSDGIIGYEIKSNSDSYARLPKQIQGYNSVCREIYMVVGSLKSSSVTKHIPDFYGIMVADRKDDGSIIFNKIRESKPNPYWNHTALLMWLPSIQLKRFAKSIPSLLQAYGGKKTIVGKLLKETLIDEIVKYASPNQIESEVITYLQSEDLQTKRNEARQLNESIKQSLQREITREIQYRLGNWQYYKEDFGEIANLSLRSKLVCLDSLRRNYLPLALEFNSKGIHSGKFEYNMDTNCIDFVLKDGESFLNGSRVLNVCENLDFINLLQKALIENMSFTQLCPLIKAFSE